MLPEYGRGIIFIVIGIVAAGFIPHAWHKVKEWSAKKCFVSKIMAHPVIVSILVFVVAVGVLHFDYEIQNRKAIDAEEQRKIELIKTIDDIINKSNDKQTETIIEVIQQKEN